MVTLPRRRIKSRCGTRLSRPYILSRDRTAWPRIVRARNKLPRGGASIKPNTTPEWSHLKEHCPEAPNPNMTVLVRKCSPDCYMCSSCAHDENHARRDKIMLAMTSALWPCGGVACGLVVLWFCGLCKGHGGGWALSGAALWWCGHEALKQKRMKARQKPYQPRWSEDEGCTHACGCKHYGNTCTQRRATHANTHMAQGLIWNKCFCFSSFCL